jgi:hypothetical protein
MEIIRNLARRRLRSTWTILGIVIGIFALTTMGADTPALRLGSGPWADSSG